MEIYLVIKGDKIRIISQLHNRIRNENPHSPELCFNRELSVIVQSYVHKALQI